MNQLQALGYHAVCLWGLVVFFVVRTLFALAMVPIKILLCIYTSMIKDASRQNDLMGHLLKLLHLYLLVFILIGRFFAWLFAPVVSQPFVAKLLYPFQRVLTDPLIPAWCGDIKNAARPSPFTFGVGMFTLLSVGYLIVQDMTR